MDTGIIILSAGSSSRLGKPKQLLRYKGKYLLDIVTEAAINTCFKPVLVILGAYAAEIRNTVKQSDIWYAVNHQWEQGMSSSIVFGITEMLAHYPNLENIVIAVSDQAFIDSGLLERLLEKRRQSGKNIVASEYKGTMGTPALFNKKYFGKLMALKGDKGAKKIFELHPDDTDTVEFMLGHIDIDTEKDFYNLINRQ